MRVSDLLYVRVMRAVLWQHEGMERLVALVRNKQRFYELSVSDFWQRWYDDFLNIDTANDWGLALWADILDVPFTSVFAAQPSKTAFGFSTERKNFTAPTNYGSRDGSTAGLTLEQKRTLIRTRYFILTSSPTLDAINAHLAAYYSLPGLPTYVSDGLDMTMQYTFSREIDGPLRFLIDTMDLLPRPSTVEMSYREITKTALGFGLLRQNFTAPTNYGAI